MKYHSFSLCLILIAWFIIIKLAFGLHSTKIAYHDSFNAEQIEFINKKENYRLNNNCSAQQIYMLVRHGSRLPSTKQATSALKFLNAVSFFINDSQSLIFEIKNRFKGNPNYALTGLGAHEMRIIASRFKARYESLLKNLNLTSQLSLISSSKVRSLESGFNFTHELFARQLESEEEFQQKIVHSFQINDQMLRGHILCNRYRKNVKKNDTIYRELISFKENQLGRQLLVNFKKRHFIHENFQINMDDILIISTLCDIENAHRMPKNWCKLLTKEDSIYLEYLNDLKSYWIKTHGTKENSFVMCDLVNDWLKHIENSINNHSDKKVVVLRFGHAENIFPLIAALNLFKEDNILTAHSFDQQSNRKFKSSIVAPFSANVAFVLHECKNNDRREHKVLVLVNELPIGVLKAGKLFCNNEKNNENSEWSYLNESTCNYNDFKTRLMENLECLRPGKQNLCAYNL